MTSEPIPETCDVAFKEWAGVCAALASGRQSVILRKGGIDEEAGGFRPEHPAFWLYPTRLHEAQQGLREEFASAPPPAAEAPPGIIELPALAVVEAVAWVGSPEALDELADLHVWTAETVLNRFHYRRPGLWVLGVRVLRADPPARIELAPEHAGCRSWVPLGRPIRAEALVPTLDDAALAGRMGRVRALSGRGAS